MSPDAPTSPHRAAPAAGPAPAGEPRWQVRLLGAMEAFDGVQRIERFPSRAVAALLARLALAPERAHSREELIELLWPGVDLAVGRNRLRQALSTLKSLLEPAGVPGAAVLQADRLAVRVVAGALACDALRFERLAREGRDADALALYGGELMPGHYDDWVGVERQRLQALHEKLEERVAASGSGAPPAATASGAVQPANPVAPTNFAPATAPLPTYLTRLFGADMAAARLRAQVLARRLVTLIGPGGSGKTRLGVEVAQALRQFPGREPWPGAAEAEAERHPQRPAGFDRIAFVSLVACDDVQQMLDAITRALQLPASGEAGVQRLLAVLAGQRVLLVLDNFEQLVGQGEGALAELLARLPSLHLLVTSRRALGLDGETHVAAEPLVLPAADASLAVAAANPAVALFADRARAVRADFHLGDRNREPIVALVRALSGMPLAIELAASRVRSFTPAEMVEMLAAGDGGGAHLALLARGGPRAGHDPRHASMAQVIAWSWRLLDAEAQELLGALTLFPADASVAAVAAAVGARAATAALGLDDLVAHSLLHAESNAEGPTRFSLVAPVREFVATQRSADVTMAQKARLRAWLIEWAWGLGFAPAPLRVAPELPLVHATLASAATDGAPRAALDLALALRLYWDTDGLPAQVQAALEQALATLDANDIDAGLRSDMHEMLAYLRFEAGFGLEATQHAESALALAPDDARRARAMVRRAWIDLAARRAEDRGGAGYRPIQASLDDALALARRCGDREAQARALHQLSVLISHVHGDQVHAEAMLEESQNLWLALGDRRKAYARLRNRAQCWASLGRAAEAMASFEFCEKVAREDGDWVGQIDSLLSLATLLGRQRQWQRALDANRRCVALCWQRWHRHGLAYALWNPPRLLAHLRKPESAQRLMAFASTFWIERFGPLAESDRRELRRVRGLVRAQLGAARAEALWIEGAAMDLATAVALALHE